MTSEQKQKACEASTRYRERNREKVKEQRRAHYQENKERLISESKMHIRRRKYNLTSDEYDAIIARGCEACGSRNSLCIDHDHDTGKVRGCLCTACNRALGFLGEEPERMLKLLNYIERSR